MTQTEILDYLKTQASPKQASFAASLIPGNRRPMLGVRTPVLRCLAKDLLKTNDCNALVAPAVPVFFEELMLRGILIGYAKVSWAERKEMLADFLPYIDNWAVCDACCASFRTIKKYHAEAWQYLCALLKINEEFVQRFASVMMLSYYLNDEYIEQVLAEWEGNCLHGYYSEMAVAWGLSVALLKYPEPTFKVLRGTQLSEKVRHMACRKALESKRTPQLSRQEIKEILKTFKYEKKVD